MGKTNDVQIFVLNGLKVNECVTMNEDMSYTIFVNADLCPKKQEQAIRHALTHIQNDDFGNIDVQQIETAVHEEVSRYGDS